LIYKLKVLSVFLFFFLITAFSASSKEGYITISDLTHNISSEGRLIYKINSKKGYLKDLSSNDFILDQIEILWFEDSKLSMKITSDNGNLNKKTGNIRLEKNIKAFSADYELYCDKLFYNNNNKIIYFRGDIKILSDTISLFSGYGEYDTLTQILSLNKNVKGILNEKIFPSGR
jgi:LPS export ABC transporter protein LptC